MKFRDHTYALGSARGEEVETVEMIDFILVMLGEPVLRGRESLSVLELHIRRGEGKLDQSLGDFGNAIRRCVVYQRRIPEWHRLTGYRIHTLILSCALENADHTVFTKNPLKKSKNMNKIRRANAAPAETFVGSLPELFNIRRRIDLL